MITRERADLVDILNMLQTNGTNHGLVKEKRKLQQQGLFDGIVDADHESWCSKCGETRLSLSATNDCHAFLEIPLGIALKASGRVFRFVLDDAV
jgi:hypothetical protein